MFALHSAMRTYGLMEDRIAKFIIEPYHLLDSFLIVAGFRCVQGKLLHAVIGHSRRAETFLVIVAVCS